APSMHAVQWHDEARHGRRHHRDDEQLQDRRFADDVRPDGRDAVWPSGALVGCCAGRGQARRITAGSERPVSERVRLAARSPLSFVPSLFEIESSILPPILSAGGLLSPFSSPPPFAAPATNPTAPNASRFLRPPAVP